MGMASAGQRTKSQVAKAKLVHIPLHPVNSPQACSPDFSRPLWVRYQPETEARRDEPVETSSYCTDGA